MYQDYTKTFEQYWYIFVSLKSLQIFNMIYNIIKYYNMYIIFLFILRSSLKYVVNPITFHWIASIVCVIINIITYTNDKNNYDI